MESERDNAEKIRQKLDKLREDRLRKEEELKKNGEKLSQKALKVLNKRNAKSFWENWGDPIGYAAIGIIVVVIIVLNYTSDRRKLSDIPVNEDTFIQSHNENKHNKYIVGTNEYFQGMSLQDLKKILDSDISNKKIFTKCDMSALKEVEIPENYNFYEYYPVCDFEEEKTKFSASYVELPISVYRNRECLWGHKDIFKPSLNFFLNCNAKINRGKKGGYLLSTFHFMRKGFISENCWQENVSAEEEGTCPVDKIKHCSQKTITAYCHIEGEHNIKKEIIKNGPIISVVRPYRDFFIYKSGIYEAGDRGKLEGLVFIKVIGWGEDPVEGKYWIIDPLWGKTWGENKLGKIKIDGDESLIQNYSFTLYPHELDSSKDISGDLQDSKINSPKLLGIPTNYIETD